MTAALPAARPAASTGQSILLIDDDAGSSRLLSEMLRSEGYRLFAEPNGEEGLQRAIQHRPALVLLDLHMPGVDGRATCRLFKGTPSLADVPVIFLTGLGLLEDKLLAFAEGAVDYIVKPFSADEVAARLRVHLHRAAARKNTPEASATGSPGAAPSWQHADERFVCDAKAILLRDLGVAISLADLARAVGTNERSLTEAFRRHTGMAVFECLRQERFRSACELLLHSRMPVGEVGAAMGFQSATAFTFAFRTQCSMTPSQYRLTAGLGPAVPGRAP